jgi:hypothetical protein
MPDSNIPAEPTAPTSDSRTSNAPWDRIQIGSPDPWIEEEPYDRQIPAKEGAHSTILVLARQTHAELGKNFYANANRLETSVAVQNQSQWSLNFDPRFQSISLHWLRVIRGEERIDKLQQNRMRLVQRETQLEHHIINGSWTLIVVLDDVRIGDIIESGYTFEARHPINADWCEVFFHVPSQFVVGRYRAVIHFETTRAGMTWKASSDAPHQTEKSANGRTSWIWEGSQVALRTLEHNIPASHLDYIWVQASDVPNWNAVARRLASHWEAAGPETDLKTMPDFMPPPRIDPAAVTRLLRHIQDDFRYLSIDLTTGGWIPARPDMVARQRFGDCKDFVWLATHVLRAWGVTARPILVSSILRKGIASLLPMTGLFNHALLEVEMGGLTRWFDLTSRCQGGDFVSQAVGLFGLGLPVDPAADALHEQPHPTMPHQYALRETILIGTHKGEDSLVEQRLWVNGYHADNFRRIRLTQGIDGFAADRLRQAEQRYGKARRYEPPLWRDDRDKNICEMVETFWISSVLANEGGKRVAYDLPATAIRQFLAVPQEAPRRTPW